jgi:integrase
MATKKQKSGRNRNGVGGIRQLRDDLFQASIQFAPGDRRYVTGRTRPETEQKLAELRVLHQQGRLPVKSARKVQEYLKDWLENDVKPSLAPRTYENYELNVRRLDPYVGSIRLDGLKPDHIKAAYRGLLESGLSARSVQQAHRTLRAALRQAVKSEYLYRDPTFGVSPPRAREREDGILTPDEVRTLFTTTEGHYLYPLWVILATTGMRVGEALGLQWRDIDLEQGMVMIRRQAQPQKGNGVVLSELKTPASRRNLPLVPGTIAVLRKHLATATQQSASLAQPWDESVQLFMSGDGKLLHTSSVNKSFHRALKRAGLPKVRPHDLRHTVSSFIQSRGRTEREVQEVLGHASDATTRKIYTHVMPDRRHDIVLPLQEFFPNSGSTTSLASHTSE